MSSLTSNLLLDPIEELQQVLSMNSFGLAPSPATQILLTDSFPINDEDKVRVAQEAVQKGVTDTKVKCRAKVGLLEGDILEISLDSRGYTVSSFLCQWMKLMDSSNLLLRQLAEHTPSRRMNLSKLCSSAYHQHMSRL